MEGLACQPWTQKGTLRDWIKCEGRMTKSWYVTIWDENELSHQCMSEGIFTDSSESDKEFKRCVWFVHTNAATTQHAPELKTNMYLFGPH